jgi:hypothetical protein
LAKAACCFYVIRRLKPTAMNGPASVLPAMGLFPLCNKKNVIKALTFAIEFDVEGFIAIGFNRW